VRLARSGKTPRAQSETRLARPSNRAKVGTQAN
jgi:hypothetical protein